MNRNIVGARDEMVKDFLKVVVDYKAVYENFAAFIDKVKAFPKFSNEDRTVFEGICEDYFTHFENLNVLEKELLGFSQLGDEDQDELLEAGHEVVSDAANFVFDLPDRISESDIGADVEFEVPV